jgi:hypothetical protein
MGTSISYTADATSDIAERVKSALKDSVTRLPEERVRRVEMVVRRAEGLRDRGFLRGQEFTSVSSSDFRKRYSRSLD